MQIACGRWGTRTELSHSGVSDNAKTNPWGSEMIQFRLVFIAFLWISFSAYANSDLTDDQVRNARILTDGFLYYHPDLKHRLEGLSWFEQGQPEEAMKEFKRAAKFADKVSQAMIAELLWTGATGAVNRPEAYAWMDLAAERQYKVFVAKREQYWSSLDHEERSAALGIGKTIYAEFGDKVAKPRMARRLREGRLKITGSRVGYVGSLRIVIPGPGGLWMQISGDEFYDDKLWRTNEYFSWQDRTWGGVPRGQVEVGDIQQGPETVGDGLPANAD